MAETLKVDKDLVINNADGISSVTQDIALEAQSAPDEKTTIIANGMCQLEYLNMLQIVYLFKKTIKTDAEKIRSMGLKFEEFDNIMKNLNRSVKRG